MEEDINISRIVYLHRDRILDQLKYGLELQVEQLSDSKLTDEQYRKLAKNVADLRDFIEEQADKLVPCLEVEMETLLRWRIEHDSTLYTKDAVDELLMEEG